MSNNEQKDQFNGRAVVACHDDNAIKLLLVKAGIDDSNDCIAKQQGWDGSSPYTWTTIIHLPEAFAVVAKILGMKDDGYISFLLNRNSFSVASAYAFYERVAKELVDGGVSQGFHKTNVGFN
jgi:hypothetical protein